MFDWDEDPLYRARQNLSISARDGDPDGVRAALQNGAEVNLGGALPHNSTPVPLKLAIECLSYGEAAESRRHETIDVLLQAYREHPTLKVPQSILAFAFGRGDLVTAEKLLEFQPGAIENPSPSGGLVTLALNKIIVEKERARLNRSGGLQLLEWALEKGASPHGNETDRALGNALPMARSLGEIGSPSQNKWVQEELKKAVVLLVDHGGCLAFAPGRASLTAVYAKSLLQHFPPEVSVKVLRQSQFSDEEHEAVASALSNPWAAQFRSLLLELALPEPAAPRPAVRFGPRF